MLNSVVEFQKLILVNNQTQISIKQRFMISFQDSITMFRQQILKLGCSQLTRIVGNNDSNIMVFFQEENIYKINKNVESLKKSYDLVLDGISRLLKSCQTYIRLDSFKCLYILWITASLSKVIFSFHLMNDERFMKCETQNYFLEICDELQQQMEIEKNELIQNQIELFLFLTKTSLEIAPNNSNEKVEILKGSLKGIIGSLIKMSPNSELFDSLFQGACLLYKMHDISNKRKQYEAYYQLDMLKWEVISYFKYNKYQNLEEIILKIEAIYGKLVKSSKNWKEHYFWILMIGKILVYNPLLTKKRLGLLNNSLNIGEKSISQIWKDYYNRGFLISMNHSNDKAVLLLNQLQNKKIIQIDRLMLEDCFKGWENFIIPHILWDHIQKCKFEKEKKDSSENVNILAIDQIQKFFLFTIPSKLLTLIKQNIQKLGVVDKEKNFRKVKQLNIKILQSSVNYLIKKIIRNLEEYYKNTQDILKIVKLNQNKNQCQIQQFKKEKICEFNNVQQLKNLMRLLEQILLQTIQEIKDKMDDQENQFYQQSGETPVSTLLQQQMTSIQVKLQNLNLKDKQFFFVNDLLQKLLDLPASLNQKGNMKEAQSTLKLIETSQKQIQKLEILLFKKNNLIECFQNLLHKLYCYYEQQKEELKKDFNESILV